MATEYGFVYVLGNDCMPGIFKIGFTMNHPRTRAEQLSSATACPMGFDLLAIVGTKDPRAVEVVLHEMFSGYRINDSREFFRVPSGLLLDALRKFSDPYEDIYIEDPLRAIYEAETVVESRQWRIDYFHSQCADPIHWPISWGFY